MPPTIGRSSAILILILLLLTVLSNALPYHAHLFDGRPLAGDDSEIIKSSQEAREVGAIEENFSFCEGCNSFQGETSVLVKRAGDLCGCNMGCYYRSFGE
jgi:hypothetical protein